MICNCVGYRNQKMFILFLVYYTLLTIYVAVWVGMSVLTVLRSQVISVVSR